MKIHIIWLVVWFCYSVTNPRRMSMSKNCVNGVNFRQSKDLYMLLNSCLTVNMAHWQYIVQQYKHLCYPASSCNLNNTFPSTHSQPDDYHQLLLTACQFKMANNGLCLLCRIGYPFFLSFLPWCHGYQGLNFRVRRSTPLYLRTVNIHHALQPWRNPFSTHRGCSLLNSP